MFVSVIPRSTSRLTTSREKRVETAYFAIYASWAELFDFKVVRHCLSGITKTLVQFVDLDAPRRKRFANVMHVIAISSKDTLLAWRDRREFLPQLPNVCPQRAVRANRVTPLLRRERQSINH